jgi:predicted Zn-dependent protease
MIMILQKNTRIMLILLAVLGFLLTFGACGSLADAASIGAQVAGATGLIDEDMANAISTSADSIARAAEEITPEQEYYIGRAVGANIVKQYPLYTQSPALTAYLNKICNAIVINSPRPEIYNGYHVAILNSQEINAFATSGGHIFLTRGLIACAATEDALASVIAHEIAHIQLQHSLKAIKNSRYTEAVLTTGLSLAGAAGKGNSLGELTSIFGESVNEITTTLITNGFSQDQEFQADTLALSLLASAGYEPSSLLDMLKSLEKNQPGKPGGFNKTHPAPAQRIASVNKTVGNYQVPDTRSFRQRRFSAVR